jgi:nitroreductase
MSENLVLKTLLDRASTRSYVDEMPPWEMIHAVVRAGQQAPFAAQLYSIIISRERENRCNAPVLFTICVDLHKLQLIMAKRHWSLATNDLSLLLLGVMDASLAAQNMVIAAESLGLGSCFLSIAPKNVERIVHEYRLPERVFPLVQLAVGYPAQQPRARTRYPLRFALFEEEYPEIDPHVVQNAMTAMDRGFLEQGYYAEFGRWPLDKGREETHELESYSWTEHVSRKWGQRWSSLSEIVEQLARCGFQLTVDRGQRGSGG